MPLNANLYAVDTKQTRIVKKSVPTESFFNFFSPPKPPTDDADADDDVASDIEERLELDYQLGEDIKEKLIPRAVDWFTGEALAYEEFDEDDMDGPDFDDDEDDEDDMSEDHDDDEESDEDVSFFFPKPFLCLSIMELTKMIQDESGKPKQEAAECKQS